MPTPTRIRRHLRNERAPEILLRGRCVLPSHSGDWKEIVDKFQDRISIALHWAAVQAFAKQYRMTVREIGKALGYSGASVSRILNDKQSAAKRPAPKSTRKAKRGKLHHQGFEVRRVRSGAIVVDLEVEPGS